MIPVYRLSKERSVSLSHVATKINFKICFIRPSGAFCLRQKGPEGYPTCCPLVRFSHTKGASKMLRATGHARMVTQRAALRAAGQATSGKRELGEKRELQCPSRVRIRVSPQFNKAIAWRGCRFAAVGQTVAKPVYLCARAAQIGTVASLTRCVASRQGARSASHRVMQA